MKKTAIAFLFVLGVFGVQAQDMTVDQIVEQYCENIGGREAWEKMEAFSMKANVDAQGMTIPIDMINTKEGKTITKFNLQGQDFVQQAFDGKTLWSVSFMTMKPEKSEAEATENYKRSIGDFPDPLMKYKKLGYELDLEGEDTKEGVECYKLKMTKKTQLVEGEEKENVVYYYMDKESFVPIVQEQEMMSGEMKGQMSISVYSDYQEVDGLYFPFSITYKTETMDGQTIEVQSMEINPKYDKKMFNFPEEEK